MKNIKKQLLIMTLLVLGLTSCSNSTSENSSKITIYTSFYPIYDFAKRVGKDKVNVINLTPVGEEPHDYTLSTKQVTGMADADLILTNGLGLENWTSSLPSSLTSKTKVITTGIDIEQIDGVNDPHVWLNPLNAIVEMNNIAQELINIDEENASTYRSNLSEATYLFKSLDESFIKTTSSFSNKYIVVSHAAFGYLSSHYGLNQIYVDGISPSDEPTAQAMEDVIKDVKDYGITTIFSEELVSPAISEKIASLTGCKVETLNPLEGLSDDELLYDDYVSVMIENIQKLTVACGGSDD